MSEVTEQEQAVKETHLIAAIVEYSDDAIIGSTLSGVITSWNPAAARMYGYSSQEIIGGSGRILVPEDRADEFLDTLAMVKGGKALEHFETTRLRKDGSVVPVSLTAAPIHDEEGAIVGASAVHREVSGQRRTLEIAQRMEAIVESSEDAIIALTLEGIITSWNPAAETLFGYASKEIIGKSVEELSPKAQLDEIKAVLAKNKASRHIQHLHTVGVRKDETVFPVSLTVSPIRDGDGDGDNAIVGTSIISRDMTELHHAVLYSRSLIEAGLDPLVTISPAGKITDVNEAAINITGVPRDELIGTDFSQYFTDPDQAREGYQRAFAQGSLTDYPLTLLHQDGTLTEVLYNTSVYRDFNDNPLGVLAVARDAAELRHHQQLSEQLQGALASRIVIEQAKGITAQRKGVTIDQAYQLIRTHARSNNASLRAVAAAIVEVGLQV